MQKTETPIKSNEEFWNWFASNEKDFFTIVKKQENIECDFNDELSSKLNQLRDGYWFLTEMYNDKTVELILTVDDIKDIVFVEELVKSAPKIDGWRFTALKPA